MNQLVQTGLGVLVTFGCLISTGLPADATQYSNSFQLAERDHVWKKLNRQITLRNFKKLKSGMTYVQVCKTLGTPANDDTGTTAEMTEFLKEGTGKPGCVMYGWRNEDGSNMSATFQYGKLIKKESYKLR